ncbi:TPA: glycosyltransferase family 2 protein [Streptococcus suis]
MTEMPLVSVIIPVYNVEDYIEACVTSVQKQTLKDIEIILVDDGSPDRSGEICDRLASEDNRIKVIHKENGGLSDARNVGVSQARADLIGFVDSDDTIEPTMYEVLYNALIEAEADVSFCGMLDCYVNRSSPSYQLVEGRFTKTADEVIKMVLEGKNASVSAVVKLYKRQILLKQPFPIGKTSEDAHFIIPYLTNCKRVAFDMRPQYHYFHREGTITTKPFSIKDLSIIEAYENNYSIVSQNYPDAIEAAVFRRIWSRFYILDKIYKSEQFSEFEIKKEIISWLRTHYFSIICNQYVGKSRKLAMTGLLINEKIYISLLKKYTEKFKQLHV